MVHPISDSVLYSTSDWCVSARGNHLSILTLETGSHHSSDPPSHPFTTISLHGPFSHRLRYRIGLGRLGRRLVRGGIRHAVVIPGNGGRGDSTGTGADTGGAGDDPRDHNRPGATVPTSSAALIVAAGKRFYRVSPSTDGPGSCAGGVPDVHPAATTVGSNPLCTPAVVDGSIYYGEYRPNPERSPVHVWRSDDGARTFHPAWSFADVRHVHGVFADPFAPGVLWVTTGDDDTESAIWRTDDKFRTLTPVVQGGQQARAVDLIFTADAVYFGSDTPREQNWIYRLDRTTATVTAQQAVAGSVFWGHTTPDGWRLLSTVVEKSTVNTGRHAELWAAPPERDEWRCILRLRKDRFHDKYFDHGQIRFPAGSGTPGAVWITPYAVHGDQRSRKIELAESWGVAPSGAVQ